MEWGGPSSNMTGVFVRGRDHMKTQTHGHTDRRPQDGRGWGAAPADPGTPRMAGHRQELEEAGRIHPTGSSGSTTLLAP